MTITLKVEARGSQSAVAHRAAGQLPGVVYGPKQVSTPIVVDAKTFDKLYKTAGESTIITLTGLEEEIEVLVQDLAFDPAKGGVTHVDFYAIERGKELTTDVPLHFIGEAPAEKQGGIVNKVLHEVEVTCRPSVLPSHIDVELSTLVGLDSHITVADLTVAEGIAISQEPTDMVATVSVATEEVDEDTAAAPDMAAIEVEKKGKEDADAETE